MSLFDFLKRKPDISSPLIPAPASGSFVKEFALNGELEFESFQDRNLHTLDELAKVYHRVNAAEKGVPTNIDIDYSKLQLPPNFWKED